MVDYLDVNSVCSANRKLEVQFSRISVVLLLN